MMCHNVSQDSSEHNHDSHDADVAMNNGPSQVDLPLEKMIKHVMFHSCIKLPEDNNDSHFIVTQKPELRIYPITNLCWRLLEMVYWICHINCMGNSGSSNGATVAYLRLYVDCISSVYPLEALKMVLGTSNSGDLKLLL